MSYVKDVANLMLTPPVFQYKTTCAGWVLGSYAIARIASHFLSRGLHALIANSLYFGSTFSAEYKKKTQVFKENFTDSTTKQRIEEFYLLRDKSMRAANNSVDSVSPYAEKLVYGAAALMALDAVTNNSPTRIMGVAVAAIGFYHRNGAKNFSLPFPGFSFDFKGFSVSAGLRKV